MGVCSATGTDTKEVDNVDECKRDYVHNQNYSEHDYSTYDHAVFNTYQSKYYGNYKYVKILIMGYMRLEFESENQRQTPMDVINVVSAFWRSWILYQKDDHVLAAYDYGDKEWETAKITYYKSAIETIPISLWPYLSDNQAENARKYAKLEGLLLEYFDRRIPIRWVFIEENTICNCVTMECINEAHQIGPPRKKDEDAQCLIM